MERLKKAFPEGVDYRIVYDPTIFVRESIRAVVETLFEAILLVVVVVMVFLQTWRASIIPLVAVPVSLVGTFAVMLLLGFSLNTLSLFGLVLAIGIVVDDAIVVVENVERHIELGRSPIEATREAMEEVSGPIIAIALVLCAVFVPTAFVSGLTGQFYRQFALTIAISTVISAFNSLTLSPGAGVAAAAAARAPRTIGCSRSSTASSAGSSGSSTASSRAASAFYTNSVARVLRVAVAAIVLYAGLIGLTFLGFARVPDGFVPAQDKDYLVAFAQLPDASTLDRTEAVIRKMSSIALGRPGVASSVAFPGLSINGFVNASNAGIVFVTLKPASEREGRRPVSRGDRAGPQRPLRRNTGSIRCDLSASAGAGPRAGRRIQAVRRGPQRSGVRGAVLAAAGSAGAGSPDSVAGGPLLELPGQRAADRRGRRSRAREDLRRQR